MLARSCSEAEDRVLPLAAASVAGVRLLTPAPFEEWKVALPEADPSIRHIASLLAFRASENPIVVTVAKVEYRPESAITMREAAAGALDRLSATPGASDLVAEQRDTTISGLPALTVVGSFKSPTGQSALRGVFIVKDATMWQVMIMAARSTRLVLERVESLCR
jgi:hypothetical protein